ncbi:hypothetical protein ElyMa_007006800 [Elysia marginata]|uniref:Fibronectin type-III domain-containing protein n=1 Tax=Elysia marginata TaxID=1093978 RepID=A0AAV4JPA9_9GAST|nr:hypothetical protein ElyMa_007006800 [Elysia marginata]
MVSWHQNSDEVKGYKVTVEKLQRDQSYVVQTEALTSNRELKVDGIAKDSQYRISVRAFDLDGLGQSSETVMYPSFLRASCGNPTECQAIEPSKPDTANEGDQSYKIDAHVVRQTHTRLRVMWFLPQGDLDKVGRFQILLTSRTGRKLVDSKLRKNQRSINLHPVSQDNAYTVLVRALDRQGNVLTEKLIGVERETKKGGSSKAELLLCAGEIRDKKARIAWALKNIESSTLKAIRLKVQRDAPGGAQVLKRILSTVKQTIVLAKLPPKRLYFITVEAIGKSDKPVLSSVLTLKTPAPGDIGEPISGAPVLTKVMFFKKEAQLRLLNLSIHNGEAFVKWDDEGEPIPEEIKKDVKVLVNYRKIHPDNSEGPLRQGYCAFR